MVSGSGHDALNERATWLAALLFAALTVLLAYPISLHPIGLRFPTGPDGDLGWYLLGWDTHAFLHKPWAIFDANIYYPDRFTLAYGENVIGIALLAAPVIWLGGNLLLAANFVCLLSTAMCGLGAYVLARRVGLSVAAAVIAGIIFQCSPPRFLRIGQMNLSSVQWIPLTLAALHAYFQHGRKRDLRLAALFTTLQVLSSGHGAVFLAVTLAVFFGYRLALGEPIRLVSRIRDLGLSGALILLPSVLVFLPYRTVQRQVGLKRGLGTWVANYESFLASPSHLHQYLLGVMGLSDVNAKAAAFLFPGYLPLLLAAVALLWPRQRLAVDRGALGRGAMRALEIALFVAGVGAALLTFGTLITLKAGTARLVATETATHAWIVFAVPAILALALGRFLPSDIPARHRRPALALLAAATAWMAVAAVRPTLRAGDGLRGEYFSNATWEGSAAFSAPDTKLSRDRLRHRWNGSPPEQFSARWVGFLTVRSAGVYHFATTSDDGSQLFIDQRLVVNNEGIHPAATQRGQIELEPGSHLIVLEYYQGGGDLELDWTWSRDGERFSRVPGWLLSRRQTHYSTAVASRVMDWAVVAFAIVVLIAGLSYARAVLRGRGPALARWADARRRNVTLFYGVLTFVTLWLSLGPPYGLWRYVYWLPGFSFIRANTRFTLVALIGLAVLAGIGFDKIASRLTGRRRTLLAGAFGILLVAEFAVMPLGSQPGNFDVPAIDRWLNTLPKPFVIAEVPVYNQATQLGAFERQEVNYMIHSSAHWQKTVHGYSGWRTAFHSELYRQMQFFPDERSLKSLTDLGVNYIVVHTDAYPPGERSAVDDRLRAFSTRLKLIRVDGAGRVYELAGSKSRRPPV